MRFALASFAALASAILVLSKGINPDFKPAKIDWTAIDAAAPAELTNAKRFEHHLPPLKPKAHRRAHRGAPSRLGSRVRDVAPPQTSPVPPVNAKCNILVQTYNGTTGFLVNKLNGFGEYGTLQPTQDGALEVSFSYQPESPSQLDFTATNGPTTTYPMVGFAVGYASESSDFAPGSYNYAYLAGTKQTPAGPPVDEENTFSVSSGIPAASESAVWIYNPATQAITAQWINSDGSAPATAILYANDGNDAIIACGDPAELNTYFETQYPAATLTCVPPSSVPV